MFLMIYDKIPKQMTIQLLYYAGHTSIYLEQGNDDDLFLAMASENYLVRFSFQLMSMNMLCAHLRRQVQSFRLDSVVEELYRW